MSSIGRNDPCPCGSGKKYKKCCMLNTAATHSPSIQTANSNTLGYNATNVTSPSGLLMKAVALHQTGKLNEAETVYQSLLKINPGDSDALHYLGLIAFQKHRYQDAIHLIEEAIKINPKVPAFHCNLGNAYKASGQFDSAIAAFLEAIRLDPKFHAAHNNLGNTFKDQGRLSEAVASYSKAISIKPDFAEAHNNLGIALCAQNNFEEAVDSYRKALSLNPYYADAYGHLGNVLKSQGKMKEALSCFQQQLRLAPENSAAQHIVASLAGSNPERASAQYVERVFDDYADKFDAELQQVLEYDIPKKLVSLIVQFSTPSAEKWNVLDLGCGTGLIGSEIAPVAGQLVGVDLSAKMLGKAKLRNLYQRLEHLDLLTMMRREKASSYDVITAADVFIYIGKLDEIVCEIKKLLTPGGIFGFSVETRDVLSVQEAPQGIQPEYKLENTCRYTHTASYINRLASDNGLLIQKMEATQIRIENGKPVHGYLVLCKS